MKLVLSTKLSPLHFSPTILLTFLHPVNCMLSSCCFHHTYQIDIKIIPIKLILNGYGPLSFNSEPFVSLPRLQYYISSIIQFYYVLLYKQLQLCSIWSKCCTQFLLDFSIIAHYILFYANMNFILTISVCNLYDSTDWWHREYTFFLKIRKGKLTISLESSISDTTFTIGNSKLLLCSSFKSFTDVTEMRQASGYITVTIELGDY